ncbi:5'-3' exonuclease [Salinisphaera sp.]|uniref:5'-3' exonuclease n=1 Tax=Salinisphaera sp. TaxID=1914330 RepID=UPI002D79F59B|nr:5'-3' exonuclease H3TH domain-containing protein [Salinisphaera sp.]HET7314147.1 5'-3' exonuclease H3TH domain-containing protein [Salinisphaera sp.]
MLLIDASVYIFRAFHALPDSITGAGGRPLNAVHGYVGFLAGVLAVTDEKRVAAAFDESLTGSFRNAFFADYKANREQPPADLVDQIGACRAITEALGVATLSSPRYEADDLIATLATLAKGAGEPVTVVTSDKDLAQILGDDDTLWDYARETRYDRAAIVERFGVAPEAIPDYLALVGDTVDNIPGVPGIGAKTAAALLSCFSDIEAMLADLDAVSAAPIRGAKSLVSRLEKHAAQARLSRRLASLVGDIDLDPDQRAIARRAPDTVRLAALCDELGAGPGLRRRLGLGQAEGATP